MLFHQGGDAQPQQVLRVQAVLVELGLLQLELWELVKVLWDTLSHTIGHAQHLPSFEDVLFGTRWLPTDRDPPEDIGMEDLPGFPMGFRDNLAAPFRWSAVVRESQADGRAPGQR